jgi:hypothetical protein
MSIIWTPERVLDSLKLLDEDNAAFDKFGVGEVDQPPA